MSRSYHTTRRHLDEARRRDESDVKRRLASIERLKEQLETKRRSKRHAILERRDRAVPAITPIEAIAVVTTSDLPYVHFPASATDVRVILSMLPRGTADNLKQIVLDLGDKWMPCDASEECDSQPDPFAGRQGYEILPGVFVARILGQYLPVRRKVQIAGYIYDPALADRAMWEVYLRLHMLMTFVHEIAHHWDFTCRIPRGRWRGDDKEKVEVYAEAVTHQWIPTYIIPYIEREYANDVGRLRTWMRNTAGVEIPLVILAGDVRTTAKNGRVLISAAVFNTAGAFQEFASAIIRGEETTAARLQFARDLHYSDEYGLAKDIIGTILVANPSHAEALTLLGDILEHEGQHDIALQLAIQVLTLNADYADAMRVAADGYLGLSKWKELAAIAETLLQKADNPHDRSMALGYRARAQMELGNLTAAMADIDESGKGPRSFQRRAEKLRVRLTEIQNMNENDDAA